MVQATSPLEAASLTDRVSGKWAIKAAVIAFLLAFVLTGVILAILR
jgi:hypothetical protein